MMLGLSGNRKHHGCFHRATHHVATVLFIIFCTVLVFAIVQAYKDTVDYINPELERRVVVGWIVSGIGLGIVILILFLARNTTADTTLGHFASASSSPLSSTITPVSPRPSNTTGSTGSITGVTVVSSNTSDEGKPTRRRQESSTAVTTTAVVNSRKGPSGYSPYGKTKKNS